MFFSRWEIKSSQSIELRTDFQGQSDCTLLCLKPGSIELQQKKPELHTEINVVFSQECGMVPTDFIGVCWNIISDISICIFYVLSLHVIL